MLLRLEAEKDRDFLAMGDKEVRIRKYSGLQAKVKGGGTKDERVIDHIVGLDSAGVTGHDLLDVEASLNTPGSTALRLSKAVRPRLRREWSTDASHDHSARCEPLSWLDDVSKGFRSWG
jgi:hypothetical protein